jgi:hypothetical protein
VAKPVLQLGNLHDGHGLNLAMNHSLDEAIFVQPGRWFCAYLRLDKVGDPMGTGTQHVDRLLPEQHVRRGIGAVPRRLVEARCLQSSCLQSSSITIPRVQSTT